MPPQGASHLLHAASALLRQKGRASGQSLAMSLRTWVFAAYMLYPVPRRTRFDNQNLPQNLRPPLSKFADQNLRCGGGGPDRNLYFGQ